MVPILIRGDCQSMQLLASSGNEHKFTPKKVLHLKTR